MPRKPSKTGMILIICPRCKFVFSVYDLGSKSDREKYMGSPLLRRSLAQFDVKIESDETFRCPMCGVKLSLKPKKVSVIPFRKFRDLVFFDKDARRLIVKKSVETTPESIIPATVSNMLNIPMTPETEDEDSSSMVLS